MKPHGPSHPYNVHLFTILIWYKFTKKTNNYNGYIIVNSEHFKNYNLC